MSPHVREPARAPADGAGSGNGDGAPLFRRIAFVGIGLINGSLARDVRRLGLAGHAIATARRQETLDRALALGLVDEVTTDIAAAVRDADLVVLGVPVGTTGVVAAAIAEHLRPDAVVTDVGSVKSRVIELVADHLDMRRFVPGHPIAGTENSGPDAAIDGLFRDHWCILTPTEATETAALDRVARLWRTVGARTDIMEADHHDRVLALTSHLPHLLAFNLMNTSDSLERVLKREVLKYAAGGFADSTRIAASDPTLWRDIFMHNQPAVLDVIGRFIEDLMALQRVIRWGEGDTLHERFSSAQAIRRGVGRPTAILGSDSAVPGETLSNKTYIAERE